MSVKSICLCVAFSLGTVTFGCRPAGAGHDEPVESEAPPPPEPARAVADPHAHQGGSGGPPTAFSAHAGAPYVLELVGPDNVDSRTEVVLTATLDVRARGLPSIDLEVHLPDGVSLVAGKQSETIVDPPVGKLTRTFELAFDRIPQDEASVSATISRPDGLSGAHARRTYGFGRAEPQRPVLVREPASGRPGREIRLDRMQHR